MTGSDSPDPLRDAFCPDCGYWLRGLQSDRCPECGTPVDAMRGRESQIPWVHRGRVGTLRAYVRTMWFVRIRTAYVGTEAAREVSYADAQRFRWVTVLIVMASLLAVITADLATSAAHRRFVFDTVGWEIALLVLLGLGLFVAGMTGVPSYLFHPRRLPVVTQNRAVALSYYACAPLGLAPLAALALMCGIVLRPVERVGWALEAGSVCAGLVLTCYLLVVYVELLARLGRNLLRSSRRTTVITIIVPAMWLVLAVATVVVIPLAAAYALLLWQTTGP